MALQTVKREQLQLHACLPFVQIAMREGISIGPVFFWPADRAEQYADKSLLPLLGEYLETVTQVRAWCDEQACVDTVKIPASCVTCVSIDAQVPPEQRDSLLVDSLYLLFFCGTFTHLFESAKGPFFNVFIKVLPASEDFIRNQNNWREVHLLETQRECTVLLEKFDEEMCIGLGHALSCGYCTDACRSATETAKVQSLVRSIRYFVDRFYESFQNLIGTGLHIPRGFYEAEDIVFLSTSFEALFDLSEEHPHIDLKHKLRPMLGLRYSNSVELLWQWVDGFFGLREQIVHGLPLPDTMFRANPNFEISYFYLGMKLFLYGVYWRLHSYQLIPLSTEVQPGLPLHFKWVSPEEILAFFWPEEPLINRIHKTLVELENKWERRDLQSDLTFLGNLLHYIMEHYGAEPSPSDSTIQWTPSPAERILNPLQSIVTVIKANPKYLSLLPQYFVEAIQKNYKGVN
ncbi:MAG: hypothetical protein E6Q59_10055 [Nitrosomonas sp.]|nr:MAG: hypothetical protein E6Q59_10055 [Nitrosomonas sp.]